MADKYVESRNRATAKYTRSHYDSGNVKLPKGTHDRIRATGSTVNGFISRAVLAALDAPQAGGDLVAVSLPADLVARAREYGAPEDLAREGLASILAEYDAGVR